MKSLCHAILVILLGLTVAVPAGFAAPRQSQQQTQQPQAAPTDASQQTQDQDQTSSSDEDQTPKNVKAGSEKDVNSVGNRNVGKCMNL